MVSSSTSFCSAGWSSDSILSSTENASSADATLRNGSHNASVRQSPGRRPRRSSSRLPRSPPSSPLVYSILVEDKQVGRADYRVLICRVKLLQPKFFKAKYWFCKPGNSRSRSVGLIWLFLFIFWCLVFLHFLWKNILFLDILGILCDVNIWFPSWLWCWPLLSRLFSCPSSSSSPPWCSASLQPEEQKVGYSLTHHLCSRFSTGNVILLVFFVFVCFRKFK